MDWAGFRKQESRIMPLTLIDWESESEYYNVLVLLAIPDFRLSHLKVLKKVFFITDVQLFRYIFKKSNIDAKNISYKHTALRSR